MWERLYHEAAEDQSDREAGWVRHDLALDGAGANHPGSSDNDLDNVRVLSGSPRTAPGGPARHGRSRRRNHPTIMSLALSLAEGGLAETEDPRSYLRLAVWLGRLGYGYGYGLALACPARAPGTAGDIDPRLHAVVAAIRY